MKKLRKKLSRVIGLVLAVSMMLSVGTGVMAEDVGPNSFVSVAKYEQVLDDGTILEKELEISQPKSRSGFSGTRTGRISHRYFDPNRSLRAVISATAIFESTEGRNECYIAGKDYQITNYTGTQFYKIYDAMDSWVENQGQGILNRYAKYEVSYLYNGTYPDPRGGTLWIKCESDGGVSDSGNSDHYSLEPAAPVFEIGGAMISFG